MKTRKDELRIVKVFDNLESETEIGRKWIAKCLESESLGMIKWKLGKFYHLESESEINDYL